MKHPLWLVGFRPFFTLAFVSGAALPLLWIAVYFGLVPLAQSSLQQVQWHAHEMLFGFGWSVLGGFLLTASKNWVKIRGLHGLPLALAVLLWVADRFTILFVPETAPVWLRFTSLNLFLLYIVGYVTWTLVWHHRKDQFRDNWLFVVALPMFLIAKNLILYSASFAIGWTMAIGLFRVAFAIMFERTIPQFMKNKLGIELKRRPSLDSAIKILVLAGVFQSLLPPPIGAAILIGAAALLFFRWCSWSPFRGFSDFGIALSYTGYLGLVVHLVLESLRVLDVYRGVGALSVHGFTFLCMGVVIPAMMIRISQGHTGRKLLFTGSDRVAIGFMFVGAGSRLVATQVIPDRYLQAIGIAGLCWSMCFVILGFLLVPLLWQARIDGREH